MKEKRKFNRWYPIMDFRTEMIAANVKERVKVCDISATGMKAHFSRPPGVGAEIYGRLEIPSMSRPFFVRGVIKRACGNAEKWEIAIMFAKVSMLPFAGIPL